MFESHCLECHLTKHQELKGTQSIFFRKGWGVLQHDLINFVQKVFRDERIPKELNTTAVVLIPKTPHPEIISQLRPISLCTILYKIVTKNIVDPMKNILPDIIAPTQSSFVLGRQIMDNVVIVQEMIHTI